MAKVGGAVGQQQRTKTIKGAAMRTLIIRFFILLGLFFPVLAAAATPMIAAGAFHTRAPTPGGPA